MNKEAMIELLGAQVVDDPLHVTVMMGKGKQVKAMLQNGADVKRQAPNGWRAIHFAALRGWKYMMRIVLEAGADPNTVTKSGLTAVKIATARNNLETAKMIQSWTQDSQKTGGRGK